MDKQIRKYSKLYHEALKKTGFSDIDEMSSAYENRLYFSGIKGDAGQGDLRPLSAFMWPNVGSV